MTKPLPIIITIFASFIVGCIFFAIYHERIVLQYSYHSTQAGQLAQQNAAIKKKIVLSFWRSNQWKNETQEIIWTDKKEQNITQLIISWFENAYEEKIIDKKINLQSAVLTSSNSDLILSFDQNPLDQSGPIIDKLMLIESLLKTIRENGIQLQTVQILVNHQPLKDEHLNFLNPWPVSGFVNINQ